MARGLFAFALVAAVCLLVGTLGIPAASAGAPAQVRIAHLSPDTPAVDVAMTPVTGADPVADPGTDVASGLRYGDVGGFAEFAPGGYAVSIRRTGSGPDTPPALSERILVPPGGAVTVALTGRFADLVLEPLSEDLSPPPAGSARVRVLAAAAGADRLDVSRADGPVLAAGLPFGGAGDPVAVPAGAAVLRVVDGGRGSVDVRAELAAGSVATVLVLDRPEGGLTLRVVLDAAAPAVVPRGGVEAGGGGVPWPALAAAALTLALGAVAGRRRFVVLAAAVVAGLVPTPLTPRTAPDSAPPVVLDAHAAEIQPSPLRVRVPAVGIDAPLAGVGLDATGALSVPLDGATAGWYADGPAPGAPGPAVLTGHVDGGGAPAVFARLDEVRSGDPVLVDRGDGTTLRFVVTRVERHPKTAFPTAAVYGPTTGAELRLITCGGAFDGAAGSYLDNVVVWARAV